MNRRDFLTVGAAATAAPFINGHRYRLFARQLTSYAKRTVDLVTSTTVLDMLSPFKIGRSTWMQRPSDFTAADLQRFRDSGISAFHIDRRRWRRRLPTCCGFSACGTAFWPIITAA